MTKSGRPDPPPPETSHAPIALDDRRGMAAQKATVIRREQLRQFQADQRALQRRQEELEALLLAAPAETWPAAAAKAIYLIQLYATTPEAGEPRRKRLIDETLTDLQCLSERDDPPNPASPQN